MLTKGTDTSWSHVEPMHFAVDWFPDPTVRTGNVDKGFGWVFWQSNSHAFTQNCDPAYIEI